MPDGSATERLAKRMARSGLCSRRQAEEWIAAGRVTVNGEKITSPALNVSDADIVKIDGKPIAAKEKMRLWLYYKPTGLMTTHKDPEGRPTVFEKLPKSLPRVISVGRLDYNSEGLLLLTNDGVLARKLEHPSNGWIRRYRVRVWGKVTADMLKKMKEGLTIDGIKYQPVEAMLESVSGDNSWVKMSLKEGKNREIRRIFEHFHCQVNRLIRESYGPFQLGSMDRSEVKEVPQKVLMSFVKI